LAFWNDGNVGVAHLISNWSEYWISNMRKLCYLLLAASFACLVWNAISARAIIRTVVIEHYDRVPQKESFSRSEVVNALRDFALDLMDRISVEFAAPAILLLGGSIGLAIVDRRKQASRE
jgi:hypothetical protein